MLRPFGHDGGVRVAYTLEQCWHRVPGGTAVSALRIAEHLARHTDVEVVAVAGRHRQAPLPPWRPPVPVRALPLASPWLYEAWLRTGWPRVERATGPVDVAHATTIVPCPTAARLVVTIHDLAFLHEPQYFTRHGVALFRRSLERVRRHADLVLCPSTVTLEDCVAAGIGADRLRILPLGVEAAVATGEQVAAVRERLSLPDRFVLFVGTLEPR
ncbi:MAG: glycosyltransferase, partial [Ilumatobacteraceae bacterium]